MRISRFFKWLNRSERRPARSPSRPRRYQLQFDMLEDRCLMTFVTTLSDNVAGSLRSAIATATAVGGDGLVEFAPGLSGSVNLTSSLAINANLTFIAPTGSAAGLTGPGATNITVNGNGTFRIFTIGGTATTVTIAGLTIQAGGGATGAGILVPTGVTLNLTNCTLQNNNSGNNQGGAIEVQGTGSMNVLGCTFNNNTAGTGLGGAIDFNNGTLKIVNSTFFQNTATGNGGALEMETATGICTITNSTFFQNSAGAGQGGGIRNLGTLTLLNTIVSGNTATGGGPDISSTAVSITENFSLIGNTAGAGVIIGANNVNGQAVAFGPLQLNGGFTKTLALTGTSATNAAIGRGTGNNLPSYVDQRDQPRPAVSNIDIGAFQTQSPEAGAGSSGQAEVLSPTATVIPPFSVFAGFSGDVRTAMGDVNGDGTPDLIVAPGAGGGSTIKVFDGKTGGPVGPAGGFSVFTAAQLALGFGTFNAGLFVAAGDVNQDGFADVVIGFEGTASGPLINIYSGKLIAAGQDPTTQILASYNAFDAGGANSGFGGGVRVASGDMDGDGFADVIAVPGGAGGGPLVSVYSGKSLSKDNNLGGISFIIAFNAYNSLPGAWPGTGLFVAVGDMDHDGYRDIILSASGSGGAGFVKILSWRNLVAQRDLTPNGLDSAATVVNSPPILLANFSIANFFNVTNGVRVGTADVTGDGYDEILLTGGPGNGPTLVVFQGNATGTLFTQLSSVPLFNNSFVNGVFVGGGPN